MRKPGIFFVGTRKPNTPDIPALSIEKVNECKRNAAKLVQGCTGRKYLQVQDSKECRHCKYNDLGY